MLTVHPCLFGKERVHKATAAVLSWFSTDVI